MAYGYYRKILIDNAKVPNTDRVNFPVLVNISGAMYLNSIADGGRVQNGTYDIGFFPDSSLQTKLDWDVEHYISDGDIGASLVAWVRVPLVLTAAKTPLYLAYGDVAIVTDQSNKTGVWNSNIKGVWHLPDGGTLTALDSTTAANNGTLQNTPTAQAGQIDGAGSFLEASSQYITFSSVTALSSAASATISMWAQKSTPGARGGMIGQGSGSALFRLTWGTTTLRGFVDGVGNHGDIVVDDGLWHYIVMVFDGSLSGNSNRLKIYIDGVLQTLSFTGTIPATLAANSSAFEVGRDVANGIYGSGVIDEVRVYNDARDVDWIVTEYNNQSNPATFYEIGAETVWTPGVQLSTRQIPGTIAMRVSG